MLSIDIPGRGRLDLQHLVLDVNGTLTLDGIVPDGVREVLSRIRESLTPVAITADTRGTAAGMAANLGIELHIIEAGAEAAQKLAFVRELGAAHVVAIGNGANDVAMLREVAVGICVVSAEGAATDALHAADVAVHSITDALGLLDVPARLIATMRR